MSWFSYYFEESFLGYFGCLWVLTLNIHWFQAFCVNSVWIFGDDPAASLRCLTGVFSISFISSLQANFWCISVLQGFHCSFSVSLFVWLLVDSISPDVGQFFPPGLVYLSNGISTPYGLFNAEIWFICKCFFMFHSTLLAIIICRQLHNFKYSNQIQIIWTVIWFQVFQSNTNNLYTIIHGIKFGLVGFYDISTTACYLMQNSIYTYNIKYI